MGAGTPWHPGSVSRNMEVSGSVLVEVLWDGEATISLREAESRKRGLHHRGGGAVKVASVNSRANAGELWGEPVPAGPHG